MIIYSYYMELKQATEAQRSQQVGTEMTQNDKHLYEDSNNFI